MDLGLLRTVWRELRLRTPFERQPEQALVMDDEAAVEAFDAAGRPGGALAGAYLYHLAQMAQRIAPGEQVLDLGCGPATLLAELARLCPQAQFTGVELSAPMLARAQARVAALGLRNLRFLQGDMTRLEGVADASVDVVVSSMALHHLPDAAALDATLAATARVRKPGGAVYLNDFGRLKHRDSVAYFVGRATEGESPLLLEDYRQSLHAAFTLPELRTAVQRHLPDVRVHATVPSPLTVVACTPPRHNGLPRAVLGPALAALPKARRADVAQLRMFLGLGGLKSAI